MLDHTAKRARDPVVSLRGSKDREPEIEVAELERRKDEGGTEALVDWLKKQTGRSKSALEKAVSYELADEDERRFQLARDHKPELYERIKPFAGLVRDDVHERPVVFDEGAST